MIEIELPRPPSVNRLVPKRGNSSKIVQRWRDQADAHLLIQRARRRGLHQGIKGHYAAEFIFARAALPFDLSNRIKVLEDWLQSRELIENDALCDDLHVHWGVAPLGVVVKLRAIA